MSIRSLTRISSLSMILFVQEQFLMIIPNVQLTFLLIMVFSKTMGIVKTSLIILIYVLLDNMALGSISLYYAPFMFLGWVLIPIFMNTIFLRVDNIFALGGISILFSFLYSWILAIPSIFIFGIPFLAYMIADIPFEIVLASSSFISVIYLFKPIEKIMKELLNRKM